MAVREPVDWDASAAGRSKWQRTLEQGLAPLGERMLELAGVAPRMRVLDVGTGTGEPGLFAARRVGAAGSVVGIDSSPAMISLARLRAPKLGLDNTTFEVMDAQGLKFKPGEFDAVLCQLVLMFLSDPIAALTNMRDCLRPGGKIAVAVLGPVESTPMVSIWAEAFDAVHPKEDSDGSSDSSRTPVSKTGSNPFRFSDQRLLSEALTRAGFAEVATETLATELYFENLDQFNEFQMDLRPDLSRSLQAERPRDRAKILSRARAIIERYTDSDGSIRLVTSHNLASARRP